MSAVSAQLSCRPKKCPTKTPGVAQQARYVAIPHRIREGRKTAGSGRGDIRERRRTRGLIRYGDRLAPRASRDHRGTADWSRRCGGTANFGQLNVMTPI